MRCDLRRRAFTLVELLAAMAVFILMGILILEVTNIASQSAQVSTRSVDAASQARLALDRIGVDLANLLQRADVVFTSTSTTPLLFISSVQSASETGWTSTDNRGLSAVAYEIAASSSNANRICLLRGGQAYKWTDTGFMGLGSNGYPSALSTAQQPDSSHFDVLAPGVICLAVAYQLYPDNLPVTLADTTSIANSQGQIVYSAPLRTDVGTNKFIDLTRISSIVVGVVALDLESLKPLNSTQVSALAGSFSTPTTINTLPSQLWVPIAKNSTAMPSTVPLPARQAVHVFQRLYPIAPFARK